MVKRKLFYINSANRSNGTNNDFYINIPVDPNEKYNKVVVLQASIPKTYYVINSNDSFILDENGTQYTISILAGNYNVKTFGNAIQDALNASGSYTYTVTRPYENAKYQFDVSGNGGIQPKFIFTTSMYEQMGFDASSTNIFVSDTMTSTNVVNLQRESTLFIHSSIVADGDVLQEIYSVNTEVYSAVSFQNPTPEWYAKNINYITANTYRFYLCDENSKAIELNGINWLITLCMYRE